MVDDRVFGVCKNCGASNDNKNPFCPKCGANLTKPDSPQKKVTPPIDPAEQAKKNEITIKNLKFGLGFFIVVAIVGIAGFLLTTGHFFQLDQSTQISQPHPTGVSNPYSGIQKQMDETMKRINPPPQPPFIITLINKLTIFEWGIIIGIPGAIVCGYQIIALKKKNKIQY